MTAYFALQHRSCGHYGGLSQTRDLVEGRLAVAVAAGYNRWQIVEVPDADVDRVIETVLRGPCPKCVMDPSRGLLPAAQQVAREELAAGRLARVQLLLTDETPVEPEVFVLPAACLDRPDEITRAQQLLHDEAISLIAQDGKRRQGPIEWRHWHGRDSCLLTLAAVFADDTRPVVATGLAQFRAFFDEYPADCVLVVASCEVSQ